MAYRKGSRKRSSKSSGSRTRSYGKSRVRRTNRRTGKRRTAAGGRGQTIKLVIQHEYAQTGANPMTPALPQVASTTKRARF